MEILELAFFILTILILILFSKDYKRSYGSWYIIFVFAYIVATRSIMVPDTDAYLSYFNIEDTNLKEYSNIVTFEYGYRFITKVLKYLLNESTLYFGAICILNMVLMKYGGRRLVNSYNVSTTEEKSNKIIYISPLFLILYISFFGIYLNAIVLRVGLAFSLIFLAATFALNYSIGRIIKLAIIFLICTAAYLIHSTAIFGAIIMILLIFSNQKKKEFYISSLIIIFLIYLFNLSGPLGVIMYNLISSTQSDIAFFNKVGGYDSGYGTFEADGFSLKFLFFWMMSFILSWNKDENQVYYKLLNILIIGVFLHAIFRSVVLIERITDYFTFYSIPLFYLFLIKKSKISFWIYLFALVIIQIVFVLRITNSYVTY